MEMLRNVMGILDMDGFYIGGRFFCKELGMWRVGDVYAKSYFFDIGIKWDELDEKAKKQCLYVIRNVHCLPFGVPKGLEAVSLECLNEIILKFYDQYGTDVECTLAYKGGHYERDLLYKLGIPGVNLERYRCPKAKVLFDRLGWLETCGKHLTTVEAYRHCLKVETEAFGYWLNQNM